MKHNTRQQLRKSNGPTGDAPLKHYSLAPFPLDGLQYCAYCRQAITGEHLKDADGYLLHTYCAKELEIGQA